MNWLEILVIAILAASAVGAAYGLSKLKKLTTQIKNLETLVKGTKIQYSQFEKLVQFLDKDPETTSTFEKVVKYLGIVIEELNEQVIASIQEYETEEQKVQYLKEFILKNVRKVIIEIEGSNSELLDENTIEQQVSQFLDYFLQKIDLSEFGK